MTIENVESNIETSLESIDGFVELGTLSGDTKGGPGTTQYDGSAGYYF